MAVTTCLLPRKKKKLSPVLFAVTESIASLVARLVTNPILPLAADGKRKNGMLGTDRRGCDKTRNRSENQVFVAGRWDGENGEGASGYFWASNYFDYLTLTWLSDASGLGQKAIVASSGNKMDPGCLKVPSSCSSHRKRVLSRPASRRRVLRCPSHTPRPPVTFSRRRVSHRSCRRRRTVVRYSAVTGKRKKILVFGGRVFRVTTTTTILYVLRLSFSSNTGIDDGALR